jgi:hypothetical protein
MRRVVPLQLFLEFIERLDRAIDRLGGYRSLRENVLSKPNRFANTVNGLVSTICVRVCYRQTDGITSDIDCGDSWHRPKECDPGG